jgi:hypothetical protein
LLAGSGGSWLGGGGGSISMGSKDFQDTVLGEATEIAVKDLVKNLIARKGNLVEK